MPKMSDSRRKRIQARQRKATNALRRAAKLAKRQRNRSKPSSTKPDTQASARSGA